MEIEAEVARWPGRVAVAIVRGDPPRVFVAQDHDVLGRVLALQVVARERPETFGDPETVANVREALLEERWADAVFGWMTITGETVDAYPDEELWTSTALDGSRASFEIRMAPIFVDPDPDPE